MSRQDLESRLSKLEARPARPELRERVLDGVRGALAMPAEPPGPTRRRGGGAWLLAALAVLLLLGLNLAEEARHAARKEALGWVEDKGMGPDERRRRWEWHQEILALPPLGGPTGGGVR